MAKLFKVLYDGASRPVIQTPTGRWLSLSQFENGRWQSYEREDDDCRVIVESLNWLLIHTPKIVREWEVED
jgi:hypothetical protein